MFESSSAWLSTLSADVTIVVFSGSHSGLSSMVFFSSIGEAGAGETDTFARALRDFLVKRTIRARATATTSSDTL